MHSVRSPRLYYFAAFCLGAVVAFLIAPPLRAETFRVDRVATTRFTPPAEEGRLVRHQASKIELKSSPAAAAVGEVLLETYNVPGDGAEFYGARH